MPLLDIRHLTIEIETPQGRVKAVDRMSLTLTEGEIRGLVGESGSGKSLVAKALVGVCKENWRVSARPHAPWQCRFIATVCQRASPGDCP